VLGDLAVGGALRHQADHGELRFRELRPGRGGPRPARRRADPAGAQQAADAGRVPLGTSRCVGRQRRLEQRYRLRRPRFRQQPPGVLKHRRPDQRAGIAAAQRDRLQRDVRVAVEHGAGVPGRGIQKREVRMQRGEVFQAGDHRLRVRGPARGQQDAGERGGVGVHPRAGRRQRTAGQRVECVHPDPFGRFRVAVGVGHQGHQPRAQPLAGRGFLFLAEAGGRAAGLGEPVRVPGMKGHPAQDVAGDVVDVAVASVAYLVRHLDRRLGLGPGVGEPPGAEQRAEPHHGPDPDVR
jgi:hypothetical protein